MTGEYPQNTFQAPLVSGLVIAYNHSEYVKQCIESVLASGYPNLELIIIDDASVDFTDKEIQDWLQNHLDESNRIQYIHHDKNFGLTRSLNEAISKAHGDLVFYISADDVMLPGGIEARVSYLNANPHKLAVFADCNVIDRNGQLICQSGIEDFHPRVGMRIRNLRIDALIPFNIVFHWAVPGPVFMCRRETFDIVGPYDEDLRLEDWDMYLRISAIGKLGFCNSLVSSWRVHGENTIQRQDGYLDGMLELTIRKNLHRFSGIM